MGACLGLGVGLASSILLILLSPDFMTTPLFPLKNPGIVSIPLGFLGAFIGALIRREPSAEARFAELVVRANTGIGAEKATDH
jgi:cation/acetate symporter